MAETSTLGPARLAFGVLGAALIGDRLHLVSRNLQPCRLAVLDLGTDRGEVVATVPTGEGAWGVAVLGDDLYLGQLGAQGRTNLYRYRPGSGDLRGVAAIDAHHIWALAAGFGEVTGVAHPTLVFGYEPATNRARDLGIVDKSGDDVRSVTVTSAGRFVGGRRDGRALLLLAERDATTGRNVLPAQVADHANTYTLVDNGRRVALGTRGPQGGDAAVAEGRADGTAWRVWSLPGTDVADALLLDGGTLWAATRPEGRVFQIDLTSGDVRGRGAPVPGSETRALYRRGGAVVGVSATERVWRLDPEGGDAAITDLIESGVQAGPERPQSLAAGAPGIAVGGSFGLDIHSPAGEGRQRWFVPGEPKAMAYAGDRLWLAVYPIGQLWAQDPERRPERVVALAEGQNRPAALAVDPVSGLVLVGSASDRGGRGTVSIYDPSADRLDTLRDLHGDGHVGSIAVADGIAYLGTSGDSSRIVALDLAARRARWTATAPAGTRTLVGMAVAGRRVIALSGTGRFVLADRATGRVLDTLDAAGVGGQLVNRDGVVYGAGPQRLVALDADPPQVTTVVDDLEARVWNHPPLALAPDGALLAIRGTDLIRVVA